MALTSDDRDWLQGQFDRVHDRVNKTNSEVAHNKQELIDRITTARSEHEKQHHDTLKRLSFLGGVVTVILGLWELLKLAIAAVKKG